MKLYQVYHQFIQEMKYQTWEDKFMVSGLLTRQKDIIFLFIITF